MFRKQKTIAPFFRLPNPANPITGDDAYLHPPMKPYCRFVLTEKLTTSDETKKATLMDAYQWGTGMYHVSAVPVNVFNMLTKEEGVYMHSGEIGDVGFAVWDRDIKWIIVAMTGGGGNAVAVTDEIIPGRDGDTPGGPIMVQKKKIDDPTSETPEFVDDGDEVEVWSWVKADSSDPADEEDELLWIYIEQDAHGVWWFTGQDCPPSGV